MIVPLNPRVHLALRIVLALAVALAIGVRVYVYFYGRDPVAALISQIDYWLWMAISFFGIGIVLYWLLPSRASRSTDQRRRSKLLFRIGLTLFGLSLVWILAATSIEGLSVNFIFLVYQLLAGAGFTLIFHRPLLGVWFLIKKLSEQVANSPKKIRTRDG